MTSSTLRPPVFMVYALLLDTVFSGNYAGAEGGGLAGRNVGIHAVNLIVSGNLVEPPELYSMVYQAFGGGIAGLSG